MNNKGGGFTVFNGFQKMTLLDFPGHVACTLFTAGCNLRCPFCHNASLVTGKPEDEFYEDEILSFLKKRTGILDGVAITGGEPMLNPDLCSFLQKVKALGFKTKVDTNGCYPEILKKAVNENLVDYVAMDIKNCFEKYPETVGIDNFKVDNIKESITFLINCGIDFEFRTTVVKEFHTIQDIEKIAQSIKGAKKYFLQNFTDSGNLIGENMSAHSEETLKEMCKICKKYIPDTSVRGI